MCLWHWHCANESALRIGWKPMSRFMKTRPWITLVFLGPNLLGFLTFTLLPVAASLVLAFYAWDLFSAPRFVGLKNFADLIGFRVGAEGGIEAVNPRFWYYIYNTLFLMLGLPFSILGSLFLACLLNRRLYGRNFFRLVYFIPSIVSGVGIFLLWKWIFQPDYGLINALLWQFGVVGPRWLESTLWAKPALMLMGFWGSVGGMNVVLYLAALQNINPELYEAAEVDGARSWSQFWTITWPMVSPTTFFILIMGIIGGFQGGFDAAYVMTRGGPAGATTTLSYYIYETGFQFFYMGRASAASWLLFLMVMVFTWINWKMAGKKVHY